MPNKSHISSLCPSKTTNQTINSCTKLNIKLNNCVQNKEQFYLNCRWKRVENHKKCYNLNFMSTKRQTCMIMVNKIKRFIEKISIKNYFY